MIGPTSPIQSTTGNPSPAVRKSRQAPNGAAAVLRSSKVSATDGLDKAAKSRAAKNAEAPPSAERTFMTKIGHAIAGTIVGALGGAFVGVPAAGFVGLMDLVSIANYGAGNSPLTYQLLLFVPMAVGAISMAGIAWFNGDEIFADPKAGPKR